jgi:hypothetical protein
MSERATLRLQIVTYLLDALDICADSKTMLSDTLRYNTASKLLNMRRIQIDTLVDEGRIYLAEGEQIMRLQFWTNLRRKDGLGTPETLAEWRESFSSDIFDRFVEAEFIAPGEAETAAALDEIEVKPRPKGNSGIKPSDYPEFDGRRDGWFVWRLEYEATAEMAGMKDVLNVVDSTDHLKKRLDDHQYDDAVTYQFSMLKKKTSKGTALAKVKKYDATRDGALAWLDLKEYYNQEGDKKTYGAECLKNLVTLTLEHANRGGMDDYINRFELIIDQLQESDQPLTEDQKKVFFLQGITDHSYSMTRKTEELDHERLLVTVTLVLAQTVIGYLFIWRLWLGTLVVQSYGNRSLYLY